MANDLLSVPCNAFHVPDLLKFAYFLSNNLCWSTLEGKRWPSSAHTLRYIFKTFK